MAIRAFRLFREHCGGVIYGESLADALMRAGELPVPPVILPRVVREDLPPLRIRQVIGTLATDGITRDNRPIHSCLVRVEVNTVIRVDAIEEPLRFIDPGEEMMMRFEIREFDGASFSEGHDRSTGPDLAAFEAYVAQFTDDADDEPARPFSGIVAGRQWIDANTGAAVSAFAYSSADDDDDRD